MAAGPQEFRFMDRERETQTPQQRRERLDRRFMDTWRLVWRASGAYRDIYREAGIGEADVAGLDDLARLPMIGMTELIQRQKDTPPFGGFETVSGSGVGRIYVNPGLIFQPGEREYADTTWAEALCAGGLGPGDRILNTFNYHLWPFAFMLDESARKIGASVVPTGVGNTLMQVRIMRALKINAFLGTPSFLMTLAQRAEGMGVNLKSELFLEKAVVGAEMLPESLRARLETSLGMTITQCYGTVFLGCMGYECPEKSGLHVPEDILVEVVDPQSGRPVEPGAIGEIVATNFSTTYPLIRMATGDLSLFSREACPCGRTGPMLKKVLGRIDQATKVRGTFVHPWQADEVMARFPEVFKYQVVVTRENHADVMIFRVEMKEDAAQPSLLAGRIEKEIKEILTVKGMVEIVPRGTIPDFYKKIDDRRSWE